MARMSALKPLISILLFVPLAGVASDPTWVPVCAEEPKTAEEAPVNSAGLQAHVDPDTGELVNAPPAGQRFKPDTEQTQGIAPPQDDLPVVTNADGSETVELGDRFMTQLRAQVIDGKLVTCHAPASRPIPDAVMNDDSGVPDHEPR